MSFILDALKKLEKNRHKDAVPDLLTVHERRESEAKKGKLWAYIIVAALVLNAVILSAWLILRGTAENEPLSVSTVIPEEAQVISQSGPVTADSFKDDPPVPGRGNEEYAFPAEPDPVYTSPLPSLRETDDKTPAAIQEKSLSQELSDAMEPIQEEAPADEPKTGVIEAIDAPVPDKGAVEEAGERLPYLPELPPAVRKELRDIKVSGHIYSGNPSARLVNVNGNLVREGDRVSSGLYVDEITVSDVIFIYGDHRFRVRGY